MRKLTSLLLKPGNYLSIFGKKILNLLLGQFPRSIVVCSNILSFEGI